MSYEFGCKQHSSLLLQFPSQSWLKSFGAPLLSLSFLLIMDQLTIRWAGDGCRGVTKPWRGDSTACYLTQFCGEWRSVVCSQSEWKGHQGLVTHCRAQQCPRLRPILSRLSGKQSPLRPHKRTWVLSQLKFRIFSRTWLCPLSNNLTESEGFTVLRSS